MTRDTSNLSRQQTSANAVPRRPLDAARHGAGATVVQDTAQHQPTLAGTKRKRSNQASGHTNRSPPPNNTASESECSLDGEPTARAAAKTRYKRREITAALEERVTRTPSPSIDEFLRVAQDVRPPPCCTGTQETESTPKNRKQRKQNNKKEATVEADASSRLENEPTTPTADSTTAATVAVVATRTAASSSHTVVAATLVAGPTGADARPDALVPVIATTQVPLDTGQWHVWESLSDLATDGGWLPADPAQGPGTTTTTTTITVASAETVEVPTTHESQPGPDYGTTPEGLGREFGGYGVGMENAQLHRQLAETGLFRPQLSPQSEAHWGAMVAMPLFEGLPLDAEQMHHLMAPQNVAGDDGASLGQAWGQSYQAAASQLICPSSTVEDPAADPGETTPEPPIMFFPDWS